MEVARVIADLIHTLFTLGLKPIAMPGAVLEGKLNGSPPTGYAAVPVKVVIEGTDYSTTADAEGRYRFHSLPPGRDAVWILATGYEAERVKEVLLKAGETTVLEPKLKPDSVPGNLVRNPRFAVPWALPNQRDGWTRDPAKPGRWASAPIRVPVGQACSVRIDFAGENRPGVSLRWRTNPSSLSDSREVSLDSAKLPAEIHPDPALKPFEKGVLFLEILLHTDRSPEESFRHVAVAFSKK